MDEYSFNLNKKDIFLGGNFPDTFFITVLFYLKCK